MTRGPPPSLWPLLVFILSASSLVFLAGRAQAQAAASPTTDPIEAAAYTTIYRRWMSTPPDWNTTSDLCSGVAVDPAIPFENPTYKAFIKCDCRFNNSTICRIKEVRFYDLNLKGQIPEELLSFTILSNLNLGRNLLTGLLPAFIGNFSNMLYLNVGYNSLSGTIPKELGNLKLLKSLGMGSNYFSGPLPKELGNLADLEQLYVDSSGLSGEIPSTLAQLQNLQILRFSDNNFTGVIPDFIGNLTNLNDLRFQGNSFDGPIPSSFAKLFRLTDLRIGDVNVGSSSLAFIQNMTSLNTLILRNCKISDTIPSSIESYTQLMLLDLSFNNLTGPIPQFLFNLESLKFVFLGNNSLSGGLPKKKSGNLLSIDLSYNYLSGSFPSWVDGKNLKLNLVANNFVISDSNNSLLLPGLDCLQKNIPCSRSQPIWSQFAINCGGPTTSSSDGTIYDADSANLTTASFYVTEERKWAVSTVGRYVDVPTETYIENSPSQVTGTLDSALFQDARLSPSSLRYYGLGLENGNYTIKLQFAQTISPGPSTWWSLSRRIFDIYIQGTLAVKDFDIKKEAGGKFLTAVERRIITNVADNFLEIHLFWAGKGTCCIPIQGPYGPSISAISVTPNFIPTVSNKIRGASSSKNKKAVIAGIVGGFLAFCALIALGFFIYRERKPRRHTEDDEELLGLDIKPDIFSYAELRSATKDFNSNNKLGEGGFGAVFKGELFDGRTVAVKQLSVTSHQGKRQFVAEIATISAVRHRNLVKLYGCCYEGERRLLVYEYLENNSLDQALFGKSYLCLDWSSRFSICLGTARALAYLHEESSVRIVHRDIKTSNILLDSDLNPKISDFGLAKLYDNKKTHISTRVAGTIGYLAPEYALRGHVTEKVDVFAFGVVAMEILSGRANTDEGLGPDKMYLLEWAWQLHGTKNELELVDPKLPSYIKEEAARMIRVALLCTQASPSLRPTMSRVVNMLTGDTELSEVLSRPSYLTEWQFKDNTSSFSGNFSSLSTAAAGESQASISLGESSGLTSAASTVVCERDSLGGSGEGR